jgi:hypothetical protein
MRVQFTRLIAKSPIDCCKFAFMNLYELHSHHRTNSDGRGGLSVRLCAGARVASWGASGCCDSEYLEEGMSQTKVEAVTRIFPELDLDTFLKLPISEQIQALDTALNNLRDLKSEQARQIKGAIAAAVEVLAFSDGLTSEVLGKCIDVLEFWSNPL